MHMLVMKNMANKFMYIVQELQAFVFNEITFNEVVFNKIASKVSLKRILFRSIFSPYSAILFLHLQLYSLNILLCYMIYHIRTHN